MSMSIDDLGRLGENKFQEWYNLSSLVVNSSLQCDATGWDCKVESKEILQDNESLFDLTPENSFSHATFDIQVKTTLNDQKNSW